MKKDYKKAFIFWLKSAEDNMITAKAMYKTGRWNFCMFMCQQTLEAMLKAVYIKITKSPPPYIHNLIQLLNQLDIEVSKEIEKLIILASAHYIIARYKEDRFDSKIYNKKNALKLLKDTEQAIKWFTKNMKLKK